MTVPKLIIGQYHTEQDNSYHYNGTNIWGFTVCRYSAKFYTDYLSKIHKQPDEVGIIISFYWGKQPQEEKYNGQVVELEFELMQSIARGQAFACV